MISKQELTMGREKQFAADYTKEIDANLNVLLDKLNTIREKYGKPMVVSSGWRPKSVNDVTANAAKTSKHLVGLAADILDKDCKLWNWVMQNLQLIQDLGLYLEDKRHTPNWVHFGIGAPKSGKRIFKPSTAPYVDASLWDGQYDSKFDKV
jgi:uncharacterized protein YcbK (DUF882 family)